MSSFKRPNILTLCGINRANYHKEEIVSDTFLDDILYQTIPSSFRVNGCEYPESTNLLCWNCDRSFTWRPAFVPTSINDDYEFKVEGNMCSFNCAYSWVSDHYHGDVKNRLKDRIYVLYELVSGKRKVILPAYPKTLMKKYGGKLSVEEYDRLMNSIMDKL